MADKMKHVPQISVGIMTHNYGHFLPEAVESVFNQTLTDWELLISDDNSTDDTARIVAPFLGDPRVRYVRHQMPLGQAGNWSFVLSQGRAQKLAVLHADDIWLPSMLDSAMSFFRDNRNLDMYCSNWNVLRDDVVDTKPNVNFPTQTFTSIQAYKQNLKGNFCLPSSAVLTSSLLRRAGLPSPTLNQFVDFEFALRLFTYSTYVQWNAVPNFLYRHHPSNLSWNTPSEIIAKEYETLPALCALHTLPASELSTVKRQIDILCARGLRSLAVQNCLRGDWTLGRDLLRRAQVACPIGELALRIAVDQALCFSGDVGRSFFRKLH
jgi:hypothetical protein